MKFAQISLDSNSTVEVKIYLHEWLGNIGNIYSIKITEGKTCRKPRIIELSNGTNSTLLIDLYKNVKEMNHIQIHKKIKFQISQGINQIQNFTYILLLRNDT